MTTRKASAFDGVVVVSPVINSNGFGGAISVATVAISTLPAMIVAYSDGPMWRGARWLPCPVHRFTSRRQLFSLLESARADFGPRILLWSSKPLPRAYWPVRRYLAGPGAGCGHVLDLDEDDGQLARDFRATAALNRIRVHPFHQHHPRNIEGVLTDARRQPVAISASTPGLLNRLGLGHVRDVAFLQHSRPRDLETAALSGFARVRSERIRLGFVGTVRGHKGVSSLVSLVSNCPELELHVLADEMVGELAQIRHRLVQHPDAVSALSTVDAILLPMDQGSVAARYQVPAKLIDALMFGLPVLATPTYAICQVAGDAIEPVNDWSAHGAIVNTIRSTMDRVEETGRRNRTIFEQRFAVSALVPQFENFLERLSTEALPEPNTTC